MSYILCIDDMPDNLELLASELEDAGHVVDIAQSGQEGLDSIAEVLPDLVILDMLMPGMSGMEVLETIRQEHDLSYLPVLVATVVDAEDKVVQALRVGANDYVVKPLEIEVVLARVSTLLSVADLTRQRDDLATYRDNSLAYIAHDLLQPFSVIEGISQMWAQRAKDGGVSDERFCRDIDLLRVACGIMGPQLEGILDLHTLERGELALELQELDANELLVQAVEANRGYAALKGSSITIDDPGSTPVLLGDHKRLLQVTSNLINNAVKYAPRNCEVRVRAEPTSEQSVRFEVIDQGPGVPEDQREEIFREFTQLSARPTGGERSTGLGLCLAKHLVTAHGGRIGVENVEGGGACFWFTVPQTQLDSP